MKTINWIRVVLGVIVLIAVFLLKWDVGAALVVVGLVYEFIIAKKDEQQEKDLVAFGNFLLSPFRTVSKINKNNVTDADLQNWKHKSKK